MIVCLYIHAWSKERHYSKCIHKKYTPFLFSSFFFCAAWMRVEHEAKWGKKRKKNNKINNELCYFHTGLFAGHERKYYSMHVILAYATYIYIYLLLIMWNNGNTPTVDTALDVDFIFMNANFHLHFDKMENKYFHSKKKKKEKRNESECDASVWTVKHQRRTAFIISRYSSSHTMLW